MKTTLLKKHLIAWSDKYSTYLLSFYLSIHLEREQELTRAKEDFYAKMHHWTRITNKSKISLNNFDVVEVIFLVYV